MRKLFVMDEKNYTSNMEVVTRYGVRAVIVRDGKIATERGMAGDFKILGGGIDAGETWREAVIREVKEESGLLVIPETIEEIGEVEEIRRDRFCSNQIYHNITYVYCCQVKEVTIAPQMTDSELSKGYQLYWATPEEIIEAGPGFGEQPWIVRDAKIIEMLQREGLLIESESCSK